MYTLNEIAKKTGISRSTISRVINNSGSVHPKTRERILSALEQYGYVPNLIARGLKTKNKMIGVITQDVRNPYYTEVLYGIEKVARKSNYSLLHLNSDNDKALEEQNIIQMLSMKVQGVLFIANMQDHTNRYMQMCVESMHVVAVDGYIHGADCVMNECEKSVGEAVDYLLEMGHTKIALCHPMQKSLPIRARIKAFLDRMETRKIKFDSQYAYFEDHYLLKLEEDRQNKQLPTAIFTLTDGVALNIYEWAKKKAVRIPEDLSVISFDGIAASELLAPSLTTIVQPIHAIVTTATQILIDRIEEHCEENRNTHFETYLAIRDSVKKLN